MPATAQHNGHQESLKQNFAEVLHDVGDLAELQWELLQADMEDARQRATGPLITLVVIAVIALGAVPVLLLSLGELLAYYAEWPTGWAYLLVVAITAVAIGITAKVAINRLGKATKTFQRSREELTANIRWMRQVVKAHGRPQRMPAYASPRTPK